MRDVFDHVLAKDAVELAVAKRKRPRRVHPQDVGAARIEVAVDPAVERMVAAANVQFFDHSSRQPKPTKFRHARLHRTHRNRLGFAELWISWCRPKRQSSQRTSLCVL